MLILTFGGPAPTTRWTPGIEKSNISLFKSIPVLVMMPEPKYPLTELEMKVKKETLDGTKMWKSCFVRKNWRSMKAPLLKSMQNM